MQDTVGVYYSSQDFSLDAPAFLIDRETARQWLRDNAAWSIHHGRDIALSPEMEKEIAGELDARMIVSGLERPASQVMGETVMRANAERRRWAVRITRSWHPRVATVEHLLSLKRYQEMKKASSF